MDWTEKYNKELETRDNELIILNAEKENINSKLKNLVIKVCIISNVSKKKTDNHEN